MSDNQKHRVNVLSEVIGVGLMAAAAAAAGTYYLYGNKKGEKIRKNLKGWVVKMKGEVLEKMETMKELNQTAYQAVIDQVAEKYRKLKHVDVNALETEIRALKNHWRNIYHAVAGTKKKKRSGRK